MPRLTRIYTRTGDDGSTALGSGTRVAKDNLRVDCYGTVDELNSQLGVALSHNEEQLDFDASAGEARGQYTGGLAYLSWNPSAAIALNGPTMLTHLRKR